MKRSFGVLCTAAILFGMSLLTVGCGGPSGPPPGAKVISAEEANKEALKSVESPGQPGGGAGSSGSGSATPGKDE